MIDTEIFFPLELSVLGAKTSFNAKALGNGSMKSLHEIVKSLLDHQYEEALIKCVEANNFFESLSTLNDSYFISATKDVCEFNNTSERNLEYFCFAVSCIQLFVQLNWMGPSVQVHGVEDDVKMESEARNLLNIDNQDVYHLVKAPHYLYVAKCIFSFLSKDSLFQTSSWWLFRCHAIHCQILLNKSQTLYQLCTQAMDFALEKEFLLKDKNRSYLFQLHIEAGLSLLTYYQYKKADEHFEAARKLTGVEFGFTGALGMRTRFQQKPVSQLQVLVKRKSDDNFISTIPDQPSNHLPKNISLDDDTLLNKVKLIDESEIENPKLNSEEHCMILAACTAMQKTNPAHRIKQEKLQAVIEFLLSSPSCWCIQAEALRLRCLNEKDKSRTVERSMTQLDNLVSIATAKTANSPSRLDLFYAIQPPPIWNLQKDLAKLYISLGAVSSALEIYERLEMWEDAILCLIRTERTGDAMKMIKTQLETRETPNLWCLLGDILQEPKHYEKAWELSKHKSTRAMTSLGCYYISKKEFEKSVTCFQKSLSLLSLQVNAWFTMGCALLSMEDYERAADAFRRFVNLDWDNYEAWTNLSAAYVRCGKKDQAFKALSEAIKCNFDKWQLWENYVAVATDVGQFNEAISAYNRLLDLKKKFVDVPILTVMVRAVTENIPDSQGNPGAALKGKLLTLFGHLTSKITGDPEVWFQYAKLYGEGVAENANENEKAIEFLHKALRSGLQKSGWEKNDKSIEKLTEVSGKLATACAHNRENLPNPVLSSLRLTINGFSAKLKQREKSLLDLDAREKVNSCISEVGGYVEQITSLLSQNKT